MVCVVVVVVCLLFTCCCLQISPNSPPNSRYSVIDCYIGTNEFNDIPVLTDPESYDKLTSAG